MHAFHCLISPVLNDYYENQCVIAELTYIIGAKSICSAHMNNSKNTVYRLRADTW